MSKEEILNLLPGDYIFREGEFGQHAYIINSGTVELVKFTGDQQSVLAELEKGALFGEMAIIDGSARSASARAKTECVLKVVSESTEDFARIHRQYLARLPGVAQMQSSFALRTVFKTTALPI